MLWPTSSGAMATRDRSNAPCKAASVDGAELVVAAKARAAASARGGADRDVRLWSSRPGPSSAALGGAEKLRGSRGAPIRKGPPLELRPVAKASERPSNKISGANAQLNWLKPQLIARRSCSWSSGSSPMHSTGDVFDLVAAAASGHARGRSRFGESMPGASIPAHAQRS